MALHEFGELVDKNRVRQNNECEEQLQTSIFLENGQELKGENFQSALVGALLSGLFGREHVADEAVKFAWLVHSDIGGALRVQPSALDHYRLGHLDLLVLVLRA